MKVEYINPFISNTVSVFQQMLGVTLTRGELSLRTELHALHEISGIIGLSGEARGTLVLSLESEVALNATEKLLMERPATIDEDVVDAIGELTNIIAGAAKAELQQYEMSISLPNIVTGKNHTVGFPKNTDRICIPFTSPWGEVAIEVGLAMAPAAV